MTAKPPSDYARLAAAVVMAAVVIGAAIIASSYLGTATTVTKTVTTGLILPCSDQVWSTSSSYDSAVPVLLMRPGSTAFICVTYQSAWEGNSSQYTSQDGKFDHVFSLYITTNQCVSGATENGCTGGWTPTISHSFRIEGSPDLIQPTPDTNYVTVVYTVTALSNATGFYDNSAPYGYCGAMPMAVGYAASQVNASDFPGYLLPWYLLCIYVLFTPTSVSVGGMNVTYVAF
jgi:hypothetical protein